MMTNIVVGIATMGRPQVLDAMLTQLAHQTRSPDRVVVCATSPADVAGIARAWPDIHVVLTTPGLPHQRNTVLATASEADVVVFFDDDFLPRNDYLAAVERHMQTNPRTVVATGKVLADGITGPGLTVGEGQAILAHDTAMETGTKPTFNAYGCNMALRLAPMRVHNLLFDERLPLYGWQEDVDLCCRLAAFGDVVYLEAARGVHLGVKSGRGSGVRLGYSQVANPLYLCGKRCGYPLGRAVHHIAKNMTKNIVRSICSEPWVDRRGRLRGNILALYDLLTGRMLPERILDL